MVKQVLETRDLGTRSTMDKWVEGQLKKAKFLPFMMFFLIGERSESAEELWKIIKYGKNLAFFNWPSTHFSTVLLAPESQVSGARFNIVAQLMCNSINLVPCI